MEGRPGPYVLPSRLCQFQLKSGKISSAQAAGDVLTTGGGVKEMVHSVLRDGGHYVMLCSRPYTQKQIEDRKSRIRDALRGTGMTIDDDQVDFRDADQIAIWANSHPFVSIWIKEHIQPGTIGPFRSWSHWAGRPEHDRSPWVDDDRLLILQARLRDPVSEPRKVVRVVGLSGVGKSRLVLEALGGKEDKAAGCFLSDIVMYAVRPEVGREAIDSVVQNLADTGMRAVLVVDNCDPASHQVLTGMVLRQGSRLSLITIDHEIPKALDDATLKVDEAPSSVTEGIINHVSPGLPPEDQRRLTHFSRGFPEMAIRIGGAWDKSIPISHAPDEYLVKAFLLGRSPRNRELLLRAAPLLAAFGLVEAASANGQLSEIAKLGRDLSAEDLYAAVVDLVDRGAAQERGRLVALQPRPIALNLAERQWKEWDPSNWDQVLAGDTSPDLKVLAARQLALLNTTEVAQKIVARVCRFGGLFEGFEGITRAGHAEVLSALAEIDSRVVAYQIERSLSAVADLSKVEGDVRRYLVWALEKIAFHPHTFDDGASLLLRLAVNENETWGNTATSKFCGVAGDILLSEHCPDERAILLVG